MTGLSHPNPAQPDDLPGSLTPLVGRDRLLDEVVDLLRSTDARLVTLVGPGGVGKTRLALEVAADLRDEFDGGARFVQLAAVNDPALVLPSIARSLGLREVGGRPVLSLLREELRDRSLLLVVDNFEQVLAAGPLVAELVTGCPSVSVLITSRARLAIRGERIVTVPPLELPRIVAGRTRSPLDSPAVRMLLSRALDTTSSVPPDAADAEALAEICRRLDGLPLAIELIAARLRVLPPRALQTRLEQRLPLLTGGPRDLPKRQRTMRDAIAWTYDLLAPNEQALFRRLSVFTGGFSLEGVEGVTGGEGGEGRRTPPPPATPSAPSVLDDLAALADWSLLVREEGVDADGDDGPRFTMLETVREFDIERLADAGDTSDAKTAHALFFAQLASAAQPALTGRHQRRWLDRLETDHDNLRAALEWMTERGEAEGALALAADLWLFWLMRGHLGEGRRRLSSMLTLPTNDRPTAARARVLTGAGALAETQGDDDLAARLLDEAIAIARSLAIPDLLATALLFRGVVAFDLGDLTNAVSLCQESLSLADGVGNAWSAGVALAQLGLAAVRDLAYDRAEVLFQQSLDRFRSLENRWGIAVATGSLGILALDRRDADRAATLLAESLTLFQSQGDRWGVAAYLEGAARAAAARRQRETAARLFGAATALREAVGIAVKPVYRTSYDLTLAELKSSIGEAAFATAWHQGQAMTSAQAVAAAVRATERDAEPADASTVAKPAPPPSKVGLSPREREVLALLVEGNSNREIGQALMMGHRTAATHVENICNKLGVNSRTAAASVAVRLGLI